MGSGVHRPPCAAPRDCYPRGQFLAEGSRDRDELVVADLGLDQIEEVRNVWQFYRDRRPETYGPLADIAPGKDLKNAEATIMTGRH